jgi:hypothetical protein
MRLSGSTLTHFHLKESTAVRQLAGRALPEGRVPAMTGTFRRKRLFRWEGEAPAEPTLLDPRRARLWRGLGRSLALPPNRAFESDSAETGERKILPQTATIDAAPTFDYEPSENLLTLIPLKSR